MKKADRRRGGISEKVFADINGIRQGMFIEYTDVANPVILFLHGGLPEHFLAERYPNRLDENFTLACWERRGSGLSYSPGIPPETLTAERLVADTLAVTEFLRARFDKGKIYLMAHSGGTFIGLQAAARAPEMFAAYIGVAQIVHQLKSEMLAHEYLLRRFRQVGNRSMVRKLEAAPVSLTAGTPDGYLAVRDEAMHRLGVGTMADMTSVARGIFWPSVLSPDYTPREKIGLWRGKRSVGASAFWHEMLGTDLAERVPQLDLPAYFFHGRYDCTVNYELARAYAAQVRAPLKGFYTFDRSAHSPLLEEPARARRILVEDVLAGVNNLADPSLCSV